MKKIFILSSEYSDGTSEINGVYSTEEKAKETQRFIVNQHIVGDKEFVRGSIKSFDVDAALTSIFINQTEYVIH